MSNVDRFLFSRIAALAALQLIFIHAAGAEGLKTDSPPLSEDESRDQSAEAEANSPPLAPPRLSLCGTIVYGDGRPASALLRLDGSPKIVSVDIGDDVAGWTVAEIAGKELVLSYGDHSVAFTLNDILDANALPAPAQEQQPPQQKEKPAAHARRRPRRIFEVNAAGILRSHMAKSPSDGKD